MWVRELGSAGREAADYVAGHHAALMLDGALWCGGSRGPRWEACIDRVVHKADYESVSIYEIGSWLIVGTYSCLGTLAATAWTDAPVL